jgi:hypothetical protein
MAVHMEAQIVPGKLELLQFWVPRQSWVGDVDASDLTRLGSYRFDDPAGEVGIETHLLGTPDGTVLQVPLTYRGAPLASGDPGSGDPSLITTMTHTVLGDRWVYDGCSDPVYVRALTTAILTGGREADLFLSTEAGLVAEPVETHVRGSGRPSTEVPHPGAVVVSDHGSTTLMQGSITLALHRIPTVATVPAGTLTLTGTWPGQATPMLLATIAGA